MSSVGVDGCQAGWFAVQPGSDKSWKVGLFPDIASLWEKYSDASLILIDIPIGLRDKGSEERRCDVEARRLLGRPRASSVFRVPCRATLEAKTYEEALGINKSLTGKGLSYQIFNIIPKIREVDELLLDSKSAQSCIRETHPELCFWALAGGSAMSYNKTKPEGFSERIEVLRSVYSNVDNIVSYVLDNFGRSQVKKDDVLDALAAAVTGSQGSEKLVSIPESEEFDARGLPMEMVYYLREGGW